MVGIRNSAYKTLHVAVRLFFSLSVGVCTELIEYACAGCGAAASMSFVIATNFSTFIAGRGLFSLVSWAIVGFTHDGHLRGAGTLGPLSLTSITSFGAEC